MGKIKNLLIEAMETPIMDACSECDGLGQVFYEVVRPQGFGRDVGYWTRSKSHVSSVLVMVRCRGCVIAARW